MIEIKSVELREAISLVPRGERFIYLEPGVEGTRIKAVSYLPELRVVEVTPVTGAVQWIPIENVKRMEPVPPAPAQEAKPQPQGKKPGKQDPPKPSGA